MRVAEVVGRTVAALGCRTAFGVVGSGNLVVTNALVAGGARFVAARHEGGAVTMADAYARVSAAVGVATVHQGPGLTNAMTGITEAAKSRTPLVVLAAESTPSETRSNFRIDQAAMVTAVGAVAERIHTPATAVADTARAVRRAVTERRTVVLNLPLDVQAAQCPDGAQDVPPAPVRFAGRPSAAAVGALVDALEHGSRPLVIAGRGAVLAGAREPLERLAERAGALLATTAVAHGLFAGNPWALGISGGFASPTAARLISEADVVVAVGASLTMWTTRHGRLISPAAVVVQVDDAAEAIGAAHRVDVGVVADAAATAVDVVAELDRRGTARAGWRSAQVAAGIAGSPWRCQSYTDAGDAGRIDPRTLSVALDELLPAERLVAVDSGHFMGYPAMYWQVPDAAGFVFTQAFQSIGLGLASAIGAAIARPDRLTVAVLGDGGALMSLPELETLARLRLPVLVVVYNDAAYGAEVHHFGPAGEPLDTVRFPDTDFAALARAAGAEGVTVCSPADLGGLGAWLGRSGRGPLLVDAKVVPTVVADWLAEAFRGH